MNDSRLRGDRQGECSITGVEIRLGASRRGAQATPECHPPRREADGSPREWAGGPIILPCPEALIADLEKYATKPVERPAPTREYPADHGRDLGLGKAH